MEGPELTWDLKTEALPTARMEPSRPDELILDRYRLLRRLGAGGFGVVWAALDERLEREVAVKVIPRDPGAPATRGPEREARVAARLNHPGIVSLYELGGDRDSVYLVSELVNGSTFAELSRAGALSDRDVARIGIALCDALGHAHDRQVIHRDVKPQNVLVAAEPAAGAGFAKLADFGVAHLAGGDPLTRTGDVVGTLAYMAPEQAEGERVSTAADVYSLALTLYEGWTGTNPVRAAGPASTARRLGRPLPPLGRARRDLPAGICRAIDAALDPDPAHRPPLAYLRAALADAEATLSDEGGLVEPGTLERFGLAPRRGWLRRRRRAAPAGGAEGIAAAGAAASWRIRSRAIAGFAAGGLALPALEYLPASPAPSLVPAALAALLVAALPRAGWLCAAAALTGWLASPDVGREGAALVLAAALAPVPLLLPRAGLLWSLPAAAALLGAAALAPLYVALAALAAGSAARRAGLAALGFLWLALAEIASGEALLFGAPDGALVRGDWQESLGSAVADGLAPLLSGPALAPMAVWALFAALLPLLVRGRMLALDLVAGGLWAAGLVGAHRALGDLLASTTELPDARGATAGAVLGATVAVAVASLRHGNRRPGVATRMDDR